MTKELLQEQLEILDRTNMHKNAAKERVIPESYLAYKNQVEQKETMLESPSTGVPVRCVITKANNLEKDAPLFINLPHLPCGGHVFLDQSGAFALVPAHALVENLGDVGHQNVSTPSRLVTLSETPSPFSSPFKPLTADWVVSSHPVAGCTAPCSTG